MKTRIMNFFKKLQASEKKGFSLVELIIVMAIMAILVGVVASQVIPYMEKSRQSKDQQVLSEVNTALVSAIAQSPVEVSDITETDLSALTNASGKGTATEDTNIGDNVADLLKAGSSATDLGTIALDIQKKFKSKAYTAAPDIYVSYTAATGTTEVYVKDDGQKPSGGSKLIAVSE